MSAESNQSLVRTVVDEFSRGDLAAVATHFAADAVWELPGRGTLAGEYQGPEQIVGFLARAFELSGGTLALEVMDVLASEHGAAQVQRVTAEHDGARLDCVEVIAHKIENGLITHSYHRPDSNAIDAFFG